MNNPYSVAIYMRISEEDILEGESNSITNQRELILDYIKNRKDIEVSNISEFLDDGFSGANFQRPSFKQMIKEIKEKKHNCLIIKDFSRLGRAYIEVSDYLEQIFPFLGVRVISLNDNYDDKTNKNGVNLEVSFKNLIHDYYCKDLSQKVKTGLYAKMASGKYVQPSELFGYKIITEDNQRKMVVDEESSKIVKRIFEMITLGYSTVDIALIFNKENISTPNKYKFDQGRTKKNSNNFWRVDTVYEIATERKYTGDAIYRRYEIIEVGGKKIERVPQEKQIVIENNHEAIISKELFNKVKHCISFPTTKPKPDRKVRIFFAKIKCHCCGYTMKRTSHVDAKYVCETPRFIVSKDCIKGYVEEKDIENAILSVLRAKINLIRDNKKIKGIEQKRNKIAKINNVKKNKQFQIRLKNLEDVKFRNYEKYNDRIMSKEEFSVKRIEIDAERESLLKQIDECKLQEENKIIEEDVYLPIIETMQGKNRLEVLTLEMVESLIEKVIVFDNDKFEIVWKFRDLFS